MTAEDQEAKAVTCLIRRAVVVEMKDRWEWLPSAEVAVRLFRLVEAEAVAVGQPPGSELFLLEEQLMRVPVRLIPTGVSE